MSELLVWREKLQKVYSKYSIFINKGLQFLLALVTFFMINNSIGVVKAITSPVISLGLALVCAILPVIFTVFCAAGLILVHMAEISIGIAGVSAIIFFIMFAFYCQFTPKKAWIVLASAIAGLFHVPYLVALTVGFVFSPVASIPVIFGTVVCYMIKVMKSSATAISNADGIMGQITLFVKAVFLCKEMWITCIAAVVVVSVVYFIRRLSIDYAWLVATAAGTLVNVIIYFLVPMLLRVEVSYVELILGNLAAVVLGLILQFFLFSVDYTRTERVQFEDDEYYYYVKAIPKLTISEPDRIVKHISERKKAKKVEEPVEVSVEEELMAEQELQEELEIQKIIEEEFKDE